MKKLTIILFITMLLSSCENKVKQKKYPVVIVVSSEDFRPSTLQINTIRNHEYLMGKGNSDYRSYFIIHYPDCKYCKKDSI